MRHPSMIKTITMFCFCLFLSLTAAAFAVESTPAKITSINNTVIPQNNQNNNSTLQKIQKAFSHLQINIKSAIATPITGIYELVTDQGILYSTEDGRYFFMGNLLKLDNMKGAINLTELTKKKMVKAQIDEIKDEMIIYPAKNEKYVINVFTDTTCGYCHKLHQEIQGYNDLGITVRYLAFPRGGRQSSNFDEMSEIWCSPDRNSAFDQSEKGSFDPKMHVSIKSKQSCNDLIMRHYHLGAFAGVNGTPGIVLADGTSTPGYRSPADMLKLLQSQSVQ